MRIRTLVAWAVVLVGHAGPALALRLESPVVLAEPPGVTLRNMVAVLGDRVVVGAPTEPDGSGDLGLLYLFDATTGSSTATIDPAGDLDLALSSNRLLLALPGEFLVTSVHLGDEVLETIDPISGSLTPLTTIALPGGGVNTVASGPSVLVATGSAYAVIDSSDGSTTASGSLPVPISRVDFDGVEIAVGATIFDASTAAEVLAVANPGAAGNGFGTRSALTSSFLVVSAPQDVFGDPGGRLYVFDRSTGTLERTIASPTSTPIAQFGVQLRGLPDGRIVATTRTELWLVDPGSGELLLRARDVEPAVNGFDVSADGTRLASWMQDGTFVTWVITDECGDGVRDQGERCDDGNTTGGDGCSASCRFESCGDGILDVYEECDDGNAVDGDGCDGNCTTTACGNGIRTAGELCEDGNLVDGDGCDSTCTDTGCGNGVVTSGETCDDGNLVDGDGCDSNCTATACGNGVASAGETCDDGNLVGDDGCSATCGAEPADETRCYKAKPTSGPSGTSVVMLADDLGAGEAVVSKTKLYCGPAAVDAGEDPDGDGVLCRRIKRPGFDSQTVQVTDRFGVSSVVVRKPSTVCVAAESDTTYRPVGTLHVAPDSSGRTIDVFLHPTFPFGRRRGTLGVSVAGDVVMAANLRLGQADRDAVLRFDGDSGEALLEYTHPGGLEDVGFGDALATDGSTLWVMATDDDVTAPPATGVVFGLDVDTGAHVATLVPPDSVDLAPVLAVVGPRVIVGRNSSALVFDAASGVVERTIDTPPDLPGPDRFPFSMLAIGSLLAVGTPDTTFGTAANDSTGHLVMVDPSDGSVLTIVSFKRVKDQEAVGYALAADGTRVLVGAPRASRVGDDTGALYSYDLDTGAQPFVVRHEDSEELGMRVVVIDDGAVVAGQDGLDAIIDVADGAWRQDLDVFRPSLVSLGDHFTATSQIYADTCGDGVLDPTEECDDGNHVSGDGCSAACRLGLGDTQVCYRVSPASGIALVPDVVVDTNLEGPKTTRVIKPFELCLPATLDGTPPRPGTPARLCYRAKAVSGEGRFVRTLRAVRDVFGDSHVNVVKPQTLCVAATVS